MERWSSTFCSAGSWAGVDDPVWDHSSFSRNRTAADGRIAAKFYRRCCPAK